MAVPWLVLAVFVISGCSCVAADSNETFPWWCQVQDTPCPRFQVLERTDVYEVRNFTEATYWAITNVSAVDYMEAVERSLDNIYPYIQGANEQDRILAAGLPFQVRIFPKEGFQTASDAYQTGQYLAEASPPKPKTDKVFLRRTRPGARRIVVPVPQALLREDEILNAAAAVVKKLQKDNVPVNLMFFDYYIYESPVAITGYYNELVFVPGPLQAVSTAMVDQKEEFAKPLA